jgi:hypothetical protein
MNDDIWEAFALTPARTEPVANRDNSLAGFQRRLLEECGYKLEQAVEALKEGREIVKEQAAALDELRTRYDAMSDQLVHSEALLREAFKMLYSTSHSQLVPHGIGDLLERIGAFWDA